MKHSICSDLQSRKALSDLKSFAGRNLESWTKCCHKISYSTCRWMVHSTSWNSCFCNS